MRTFLVGHISRLPKSLRWSFAGAVVACIAVRLAPYLIPIRAADITIISPAVDFFDRDGLPLGTLLSRDQEHTAFVPLAQVAPDFLHAIVAAEDGRFYQHGVVDASAAARAAWQFMRERRVVSGASTITMQLARMLSPGATGIKGKIAEVWGGWRVAAGMDRQQILEAYVNRLPMGGNVYGVEAAARTYFGIPAAKLDLAQASLLAALPNDPTRLNPYSNLSGLRDRQQYVLTRMVADRYISASEAAAARAESVTFQPRGQGIAAGAHFLFYTVRMLAPGATRARTTLDRPLQEFVETQIRQTVAALSGHDVHQAAALVVDNRDGDVLAYAGSADYFDEKALGRNDGVQSLRQPGSTLKPFLYQDALENHAIRPNTILEDTPAFYAIPGGMLYSPTDYSEVYLGPVRVRAALADSLNVPAVRVLALFGTANFLDRLRELGFAHLDKPPEYYGLGLTLGSGEVSLWELAHAYLTAARAGDEIPLRVLLLGQSLRPAGANQIGDAATWQLVTDMLADAHARSASFGVDSLLAPPFPAAVKTGTSSDYRDTWTVGYTSEYTVAVWVGNFDGRPMRHVSGVTGAAPLWNRIMLRLHERSDPAPFAPPAGLVREPICATTGAKPSRDCPAVVLEYLYPQDLAGYFHTADASSPVDLASTAGSTHTTAADVKPAGARDRLRILFPSDGDEFLLHAAHSGVEIGDAQALELQAAAPLRDPVRWRVNGRPLAALTARGERAVWPLRAGAWTISATAGGATERVRVYVRRTVVQPLPTGFSTAPPVSPAPI